MCNLKYNAHTQPYYYLHNILKATDLLHYNQALMGYKFRIGVLPSTFNSLFKFSYELGDRQNRESMFNFHLPPVKANKKYPFTEIVKAWNRTPIEFKNSDSITVFKKTVKQFLVEKYDNFFCDKTKCYACSHSRI